MFRNINLSDLENILQRNLRADRARKWIFRAFGGTVLKIFLLCANHDGAFAGSMYVPVCPEKLWIHH